MSLGIRNTHSPRAVIKRTVLLHSVFWCRKVLVMIKMILFLGWSMNQHDDKACLCIWCFINWRLQDVRSLLNDSWWWVGTVFSPCSFLYKPDYQNYSVRARQAMWFNCTTYSSAVSSSVTMKRLTMSCSCYLARYIVRLGISLARQAWCTWMRLL